MAIVRGISVPGQLIPNATSVLYNPSNTGLGATRGVITAAVSYANASTADVELYIIPDGGSASTATQTIKKSFAPDEEYTWPELIGQSIQAGGSLSGNDGGNGGSGVNIVLTVTEFSGDS